MYVVVHHHFKNPEVAFARGERLIKMEGAPAGVKGLQFYPAADGSGATCLWESPSVEAIQGYVDETLGDSSTNITYAVDAEHAFARQPLGIPEQSPIPPRRFLSKERPHAGRSWCLLIRANRRNSAL